MSIQQHIFLSTSTNSFTSECWGWGKEDPSRVKDPFQQSEVLPSSFHSKSPLTMPSISGFPYKTPLHAMRDGWHLFCPPTHHVESSYEYYDWWLVKSV